MSFQNEGTELTGFSCETLNLTPHNLWSCNDDDESIQQPGGRYRAQRPAAQHRGQSAGGRHIYVCFPVNAG